MEVKYVEKRYLRSHLRTELGTILSRVNPCFQRKISTLRFCNLRDSSLLNSQLPIQASASSVTVNTDRLAPECDAVFKACADVETVQATALHVSNSEGVLATGDNLSEAQIVQEIVSELIDNVIAAVEAKVPVVKEILDGIHLEGDKLNDKANNCMLEWDDDNAVNPKAASEAEIIQEVVNELIDNVTATVEAKPTVVRETSNALHLEGDKLNGTAHECMLELDNESAINYPKVASETEIIQDVVNELVDNVTATVEAKAKVVRETANALHLEGDKFNGTTLEFMLDCDNKSAINPEAASEAEIIQEVVNELIDNVTATVEAKAPVVRETLNALHLEGDKLNGTAHEFMLEWDNDSAINPEAASEAEIIQEVVNELIDNVTATVEAKPTVVRETSNALHLEGDKLNGTAHECMLELDNESAINYPKVASETEIIQDVVNELVDNVTATVEAKAKVVRETANALHLEGDKFNGTTLEFMLDCDNKSAINPEAASEAEIIQEVVNELIDNVTATVEVKAPVVRETLNFLYLEGDKLNGTAHESMLEWDNESAINYPEAASEAEIIQNVVNELVDVTATVETKAPVVKETSDAPHLEGDKFNGTTLELMLQCDNDIAVKPEAASEAEIIQEIVNELIDNVTATVEAKAPVVRETLNALHLEGDKLNGTAHEFMLEWDNDSAINPEAASEAEIIQEVVNELIDNVTATVEAKAPVVRETLNALHLEGDKFNASTLEFMLEWDDEGAIQPENATDSQISQGVINSLVDNVVKLETQGVPVVLKSFNENLNDFSVEDDKLNGTAHECTLEWETVGVFEPQTASEVESVNAVTESSYQEEVVSCVALAFSTAEVENSAVCKSFPDFAVELESVGGVTEIPLEEEIVNVTAQDLTADVRNSSVSELESVTKGEDIDSAAETIQAVLSELIDVIELESDDTVVFESASETLNDIPAEVDMPSSVIHEFTLEWEDVSAIEPERADKFQSVTEVTETFEKEEVFSDVEHEFSPAEVKSRTVSGLHAPELAFDSQSESATADIFLELSHFVKITHESVPAKKDSAFFSDGSNQMENGKDDATIYDEEVHAAERKTGNIISNESSLELKSVSEIVQFPLRIKTLTHQLTPELQLVSL